MADFATLIWQLKQEARDPDLPVVGFGGSYGGMLATWFRAKYPHLMDGAIAGSGAALLVVVVGGGCGGHGVE